MDKRGNMFYTGSVNPTPDQTNKNTTDSQRPDCSGLKREASAWLILCVAFAAGLLWPAAASGLEPNAVEETLANLIVDSSAQKRAKMIHDPILLLAARAKAEDLGTRDYAAHVDPDGYGPNAALKAAGYGLPAWWDDQMTIASNTVESLGYGGTAATVFDEWLLSPGHRQHILGEVPFFAEQTHFAIGYAHVPGSQYEDYFVFMSAPPNESAHKELEPYSEWLFERYSVKEILTDGDEADADRDGLSRLLEFVLDKDPNRTDYVPYPRPAPASRGSKPEKLEWPLSLREPLGSVDVFLEIYHNRDGWQRHDVRREGDGIILDLEGPAGFFRLSAQR